MNPHYIAYHNENGACRFGRVISASPDRFLLLGGTMVQAGEVFARADTLAALSDMVDEHRATCERCALATEALRIALKGRAA